MAVPTYLNEGGGDKVLSLTDAAEAAKYLASIEISSSPSGYGWMGVATHVEGDAVASPGGFTVGAAPLLLMGGDDGTNVKPLQLDAQAFLKIVLQAGTEAFGKLAANSGVDIGDVDILSIAAGDNNIGNVDIVSLPAGNLGQQTAAASLSVAPATDIADATYIGDIKFGEALPAGTAEIGKLAAGSAEIGNVKNAGTFAVQVDGAALTALQLIDNIVSVEDAVHGSGDSGVMSLAVRNDTLATLVTADGDYAPLQVDADGALFVSIRDGGNSITIDGTVTASNAAGDIAHDGADSGNPIKLGGRAQEPTSAPDEVADNDRADALFDRNGYLRVRGDFNPQSAVINDSTSGNNTIVAASAGKKIAVWAILIVSDGTTDVRFEDGADGSGGTFTGQIPLQAREGYSISAGGLAPLWVGTSNTLLNLELTAAVNVHGFVSYTLIDD